MFLPSCNNPVSTIQLSQSVLTAALSYQDNTRHIALLLNKDKVFKSVFITIKIDRIQRSTYVTMLSLQKNKTVKQGIIFFLTKNDKQFK